MARLGSLVLFPLLLAAFAAIGSFRVAVSAETRSGTPDVRGIPSPPAAAPSSSGAPKSPFKIIIDGGSTGSRLHIFEFVEVTEDDNEDDLSKAIGEKGDGDNEFPAHSAGANAKNASSTPKVQRCIRRGSSRADIPLSAFGRLPSQKENPTTHRPLQPPPPPLDPAHVAAHLIPLFEYAAQAIPLEFHATTGVFYQATAGMRLLDESEQEAIYDALYQGLRNDERFVFSGGLQRRNIATLSGELEGYFGAVAANFLQGVIDTELRLIDDDASFKSGTSENKSDNQRKASEAVVGALDMGGASSQIVYMANPDLLEAFSTDETCRNDEAQPSRTCEAPDQPQLSDEHFFSTSYLSYGVDQFRERLWTTLVAERRKEEEEYPESCAAKVVSNPCANVGYSVEWEGFTLIGTGDTDECIRQTQRLIPHPEIPDDDFAVIGSSTKRNVVGGVEHPPIRGKFLGMSLYFFTLDSLRVFSEPRKEAHEALNLSWPNPSIDELHHALDGLCAREWHSDMALQEGVHQFSRPAVLPHRCFEAVYMVTLLKDGFGFHPSSRDITFTYTVEGDEVEWTLGMALAMNAEERLQDGNPQDKVLEAVNGELSIDKQFTIQAAAHPYLLFGVTSSPTHCC